MNLARKRRLLIWLNVSVMTLLMAAFLVGVNLVAHSRFVRIDMTTDKVWEISPQSRQVLRSIPRDLHIFVNDFLGGPTHSAARRRTSPCPRPGAGPASSSTRWRPRTRGSRSSGSTSG
jgi:hypothetical protein